MKIDWIWILILFLIFAYVMIGFLTPDDGYAPSWAVRRWQLIGEGK
jgi:hypothetical protein